MNDFSLEAYNYYLPDGLIASRPPEKRGDSRLMLLRRHGIMPPADYEFSNLPELLPKDALLVTNNSRVFPARMHGRRWTGGKVEFMLLTPLELLMENASLDSDGRYFAEAECLLRCGGKIAQKEIIKLPANLIVQVLERGEFGRHKVRMIWEGNVEKVFSQGEIPLPPYLKRKAETADIDRYQTVYAQKTGSVAAPTAGLHFTREMKSQLECMGFGWTEITLHVGYGTFSPVRSKDIREHEMHAEYIEISRENAALICEAHARKRPIIAVGTTSLRALEGIAQKSGKVEAYKGWINIFLYPGKKFHIIDGLITNFHLPCSTLLMLVAAFCGRDRILAAYRHAIDKNYRFFSYGDAMLIR